MISEETVQRVADIARLRLSDEEVKSFSEELAEVIDYFEIIDEVNVKDIKPSFHPLKTVNNTRRDVVGECLDREKVLEQAVHTKDEYIKAPRIL